MYNRADIRALGLISFSGKAPRFTLGVGGLRVCSLNVAPVLVTVRNRSPPFAWGLYGGRVQITGAATRAPLWGASWPNTMARHVKQGSWAQPLFEGRELPKNSLRAWGTLLGCQHECSRLRATHSEFVMLDFFHKFLHMEENHQFWFSQRPCNCSTTGRRISMFQHTAPIARRRQGGMRGIPPLCERVPPLRKHFLAGSNIHMFLLSHQSESTTHIAWIQPETRHYDRIKQNAKDRSSKPEESRHP